MALDLFHIKRCARNKCECLNNHESFQIRYQVPKQFPNNSQTIRMAENGNRREKTATCSQQHLVLDLTPTTFK